MTGQSRQPAGVPTGGQFAASAHAESGVALADGGHAYLDGDQRQALSEAALLSAAHACRSEAREDQPNGYHLGIAQMEAEAFWLLQREEVPEHGHEIAWHADQFVAETLAPGSGSHGTAAGVRDFAENLGPYEPLTYTAAQDASDHFMARAIDIADRIRAQGLSLGDRPGFDHAALPYACKNAIRFRSGQPEPPQEAVDALAHYLRAGAWQRQDRLTKTLATRQEGRAAFEECFEHYPYT